MLSHSEHVSTDTLYDPLSLANAWVSKIWACNILLCYILIGLVPWLQVGAHKWKLETCISRKWHRLAQIQKHCILCSTTEPATVMWLSTSQIFYLWRIRMRSLWVVGLVDCLELYFPLWGTQEPSSIFLFGLAGREHNIRMNGWVNGEYYSGWEVKYKRGRGISWWE